MASGARRGDPLDRPVDRFLLALCAVGPDAYSADPERLGRWLARCPACAGDARRLEVLEVGQDVRFRCVLGCSQAAILGALKLAEDLYRTTPALTRWGLESPAVDGEVARAALDREAAEEHLLRALDREAA